MARRHATQRFGVRRSGDLVWVSTIVSHLFGTETAASFVLLPASTWARNATSGERATVLRIHGQFGWVMDDGTPASGTMDLGFMLSIGDDDATSTGNWLNDASLLEPEAPMHTYKRFVQANTNVLAGSQAGGEYVFDVKTKRKITTGQTVDVSFANNLVSGALTSYRLSLLTRVLVKPS